MSAQCIMRIDGSEGNCKNAAYFSKISYARPCRHGCYRQAIRLRSNAPARGARYHRGFAAAPRKNPI